MSSAFFEILFGAAEHAFEKVPCSRCAHLGKIWMYDIATDQLLRVAKHNPSLFGDIGVPATAPFNQDEESSGIIDVSAILGPGRYLVVSQAHYSIPGELVEGGQLLLINTNAPTATVASGVLTVGGTINDDQILVNRQGASFQVVVNGKVIATVPASGISQIVVSGESGNDVIMLAANITLPTIVHGGWGNDLIFGSNGANDLYGDEGNDILMGGNGADSLDGGDDEDWLFGENGLDLLTNGEHDWQ